jgi:hypothetical protein
MRVGGVKHGAPGRGIPCAPGGSWTGAPPSGGPPLHSLNPPIYDPLRGMSESRHASEALNVFQKTFNTRGGTRLHRVGVDASFPEPYILVLDGNAYTCWWRLPHQRAPPPFPLLGYKAISTRDMAILRGLRTHKQSSRKDANS